MQPKEFIPALTRQKIRKINRPEVVAEVIRHDVMHPEWVHVHEIDYPGAEVVSWNIKDCEPVPNQKVNLRVGDRVHVMEFAQQNTKTFGTIDAIRLVKEGKLRTIKYRVAGEWIYSDEIRAATPEEIEANFRN
jgi:hypothetical protein